MCFFFKSISAQIINLFPFPLCLLDHISYWKTLETTRFPNRPVHKLEMGFPFPLPIKPHSFHWKTRDTTRLRLSKQAVAENWIFVFKLGAMDDSNSDLIFYGEAAENIQEEKRGKKKWKLECQSQNKRRKIR